MTPRNDNNHPQLVELACRLDEDLDRDKDSHQSLAASSGQLDPTQLDELRRAGAALDVLRRVRRNMTALQQLDEQLSTDESAGIANDSTIEKALVKTKAPLGRELPRTLGRFEILDVLGQGGFNRVFLARDPQLDRLVALKVPRPDALARDSDRRRFQREAHAAAVLGHPAIVPIFEAGTVGPITYIAFGYCDGETLSHWFAKQGRSVPPAEAARIVARLSEATEHAHQRGVIHRDLKPANVLIENAVAGDIDNATSSSSIADRLRITDFGLAKLEDGDDESLTIDGAIVGTPAYMSPEQARGDTEVTAATDVFSLGTILYELLTGTLPFKKETHLATLRAIESAKPTDPRRINPAITKDLDAICLKCLSKEPKHRYLTADALASDLRLWLADKPIQARHATALEQVGAWYRRSPALATVIILLFVSIVAGLAATSWQWQKAARSLGESQRQSEIAQRQGARAERHLLRAQTAIDQMIGDVADQLTHTPELTDLRKQLISKAVTLQQELLDEERDAARVSVRTARAYDRLAALQGDMGQTEEALASCERAISMLQQLPEADRHECGLLKEDALLRKASCLKKLGREDEAVEIISRVQAELTGNYEPSAVVVRAEAMFNAATIHQRRGRLVEAAEALRRGLDLVEQVPPEGHSLGTEVRVITCRLADTLGVILLNMGQLEESERFSRIAKAAIQPVVDSQGPNSKRLDDLAICILNLGNVLNRKQKFAAAAEEFRIGRSQFGQLCELYPDKIRYPLIYIQASSELADALVADESWKKALAELEKTIQFHQGSVDRVREHPATALPMSAVHANLAKVYAELERPEEERAALQKAIDIIQPLASADPRPVLTHRLGSLYSHYAETLWQSDRSDQALSQAETARQWLSRSYQASPENIRVHEDIRLNTWRLAQIHWESESYDLAQQVVFAMLEQLPDDPRWQVEAARILDSLSSLIDAQESLADAHADELRSTLRTSVSSLLRQAIAAGFDERSLVADGALNGYLN